MEIPKIYDPSQIEDKWYAYWMKKVFFSAAMKVMSLTSRPQLTSGWKRKG